MRISETLKALVAVFLLASHTDGYAERDTTEWNMSIDPSLTQESLGVIAAWQAYGMALISAAANHGADQLSAERFEPNFSDELHARQYLLQMWRKVKAQEPHENDIYLDMLEFIEAEGFLDEYVWSVGETNEWEMPSGLQLEGFSSWVVSNKLELMVQTRVMIKYGGHSN